MQSIHRYVSCGAARPQRWSVATAGAVMLAIVWSGWAAEPQKAPTSASGAKPVDSAGPAPVMFAPMAGGTNLAVRPSPFSAEISADFIKKVKETSAKIEEARRQIAERQAKLYESNPDIKACRAQMIEQQQKINQILDADPELAELKMSRDILWSTMPAFPKGQGPASMPRMPSGM